jgi:hypothetical protein
MRTTASHSRRTASYTAMESSSHLIREGRAPGSMLLWPGSRNEEPRSEEDLASALAGLARCSPRSGGPPHIRRHLCEQRRSRSNRQARPMRQELGLEAPCSNANKKAATTHLPTGTVRVRRRPFWPRRGRCSKAALRRRRSAYSTFHYGALQTLLGETIAARAHYRMALSLFRRAGADRLALLALMYLADMTWTTGDDAAALAAFRETMCSHGARRFAAWNSAIAHQPHGSSSRTRRTRRSSCGCARGYSVAMRRGPTMVAC